MISTTNKVDSALGARSRQPATAGFTLVEMCLVLAVLVAIGAIAWPSVRRAYESTNLKNAAGLVQAAFGRARVKAMSTGVAHAFRFEPNASQFMIACVDDGTAATESSSSDSSAVSTAPTASTTTAGSTPTSATGGDNQLPDGIVFVTADRTADSRATAADSTLELSGQSSTTAPAILFYPDGTTSDASVTIGNQYQRCIKITLRGLTGISQISDVFTGDGAGGFAQ